MEPRPLHDWKRSARGMAILIAVYLVVVYLIPRPVAVKPEGWRLTGIFIATIVGSTLQPLPGGALVLLAVTLCPVLGALTIDQALSGYGDKTVWLVLAAFFISRALLNTGLARRIALLFVRQFGKTSLGVSYSLSLSEFVLASAIPSNGARSGGVILPIASSVAEIYDSRPGETAGRLGSYLMTTIYQTTCISSAMFLTGQASNPLAARMAAGMGYTITWAGWLRATIVPGLVSLLVVPWAVMRLNRPSITQTPEIPAFAARELEAMGPMKRAERILAVVFASVCGLWISSSWTGLDITVVALLGGMVLLLTGVLSWQEALSERVGWDTFIWYGGLVRMGQALNDYGVTKSFAESFAGIFHGGWVLFLAVAIVVYFYAHYAFASITTHIVSMFPAFAAVLLAEHAPIGLVMFTFATLANLSACLTHYGTTPAPMYFVQGFVSLRKWWTVGLVVSFLHLLVWCTVGFGWWKLLRIW